MQQARKEAEVLVALRRACSDASEACRATTRSTAIGTSKKRAEFADQCKRLNDRIAEFVKISEVKQQQKSDYSAFADMCSLQLTKQELVFPEATSRLESLAKLVEAVQALRKTKMYPTLGPTNTLVQFTEQMLTGLDKCRTIMSDTALDSTPWSTIPNSIISLTMDLISQPSVSSCVEEGNEQLKRLSFAADECAEQQAQAVQDGDMKLCEVLYFKKISTQEAMVEVFTKMYNTLDQCHVDGFLQPMKKVHIVHTRASEEVSAIMKRQDLLKSKIRKDMLSLEEAAQSLRTNNAEAANRYQRFTDDCKKSLEVNQKQQDQCLAAIEELEKRVVILGEERTNIVDKQILCVEKEKKRLTDVANFSTFQQRQQSLLQATLQNAEAAEEVTDIVDEILCNGCNQIEQHLKRVDMAVEKERERTHEIRLAHFRNLYLTLGDLQYKKERNLEELDKKIAHTHIQQELAMETFNPKAKEFSQMKKDLIKVREEMETQLNVLQQKSILHIEAFKPTEIALVESGKSFLHPVEELDRMNRNRQQKLLDYHKLMGSEEGVEPVSELQAIEDARNNMQPRKPKSSSGITKRVNGFGLTAELQPLVSHSENSPPSQRLGPNS